MIWLPEGGVFWRKMKSARYGWPEEHEKRYIAAAAKQGYTCRKGIHVLIRLYIARARGETIWNRQQWLPSFVLLFGLGGTTGGGGKGGEGLKTALISPFFVSSPR